MTFVYAIILDTWSDGGYDHRTEIIEVCESEVLANYRLPETHDSQDYNEQYTIKKMEIQNNNSLIAKLKADLEKLEVKA